MQLSQRLAQGFSCQMQLCLGDSTPNSIGIALSGGGDSTALTKLMSGWAADKNITLKAVTIDHGLRPEAVAEAVQAGNLCQSLGIPHQTLKWQGWNSKGNLQQAARNARRELIAGWAQENDLTFVALGHTIEDQAETFLMRLGRGSGVDGLSAMAASTQLGNLRLIRPLLTLHREDLRAYLRAANLPWSEDPSNQDHRYTRVKTRQAMAQLAPLGITVQGLADTAARLKQSRDFMEHAAQDAATTTATPGVCGDLRFDAPGLFALHEEMQYRLLSHGLKWVGSNPYRPRFDSLKQLLASLKDGRSATLAGCQIIVENAGSILLLREFSAVQDLHVASDQLWDNRWRLEGSAKAQLKTCHIAVLGAAGLAQCADWRLQNHPRASLMVSPGLWQGATLIAAPLAGMAAIPSIKLQNTADQFFSSMITH